MTDTTPYSPNTTGGQEVGVVFATRGSMFALGVLRHSLLAYALFPEGRGAYALCVMLATCLGAAFTFSVEYGAQYWVMAKRMSVSRGLFLTIVVALVGSGLAAAVAVSLNRADLAFFQNMDTSSFYLSLALLPFCAISYAAELQLAGLRHFVPLAVLAVTQSVVAVLGIVVLVWKLDMGVEGAILALIAAHVVLCAGSVWYLRKHCGLAFEMPSRAETLRVLGYGLRHHAKHIGDVFQSAFGVLVLGLIAGRVDIGLFAAANALVRHVKELSNSVGVVLYPRVAGRVEKSSETIALNLRLICLATGSTLALMLALSEPLVELLLSEPFLPAVPLMWILAPGMFADAAGLIFTTYFNGTNRPGVCSWAVWLGLGANVVVLLALYPMLGVAGIAWAVTVGLILRTVFLGFMFQRATGMTLCSVWLPRGSDFAYLQGVVSRALSRAAP